MSIKAQQTETSPLSRKSTNDRGSDLSDWALSVALALWILFVIRANMASFVRANDLGSASAAILTVVAAVFLTCLIRPCLGSYFEMYHATWRGFWRPKTPGARTSSSRRRR